MSAPTTKQAPHRAPAKNVYDRMHPHGKPSATHSKGRSVPDEILEVSAVAVINAAGQILAGFNVKRQVWDLPQGVVEGAEPATEAAARELQEETGLIALPGQLELIASTRHLTPEFIQPFRTNLFLFTSPDITGAYNAEPDKCERLMWMAPIQIPQPRGLSLRLLLTLMGRG